MKRSVVYMGDVHGNWANIRYQMKMKKMNDFIVIQVGDFGVGFNSDFHENNNLKFMNDFLVTYNSELYVIRGNHDNPRYFNGDYMDRYSNIKLIPDYTVMNVEGNKTLFVGGATSIDRKPRILQNQIDASHGINRCNWWSDEPFVLDNDKLKDMNDIDVVVTHTSPGYAYPEDKYGYSGLVVGFAGDDPDLYIDLTFERNRITRMCDILKENGCNIKHWVYGHFHNSIVTEHDGIKYTLLGINEIKML